MEQIHSVIMSLFHTPAAPDALRRKVRALETEDRTTRVVLPFGIPALDARLPSDGLAYGALHEVAGGADCALHGAAAASFTASLLARADSDMLWCLRQRDLFVPFLSQVGLPPDRITFAEAGDEAGDLTWARRSRNFC